MSCLYMQVKLRLWWMCGHVVCVFIAPQFFDRIKLFGMPAKHQPDLIYLRYVPLWKVHIFTIVQLTCLVLLWVIKASAAAVVFPMMVRLKFTIKSHSTPLHLHLLTSVLCIWYFLAELHLHLNSNVSPVWLDNTSLHKI